ncbi:tektin-4 isoform X2 [Thalassophryne amazonica]|uniref:tektin-4 isoform X2 n=1 Tax=Thalassophryne amazonica TaxID=390379 RepID=UPI001471CD93|nr:tektin-4 isoform X2 [Thalassophryne amazonica]
MSSALLVSRPHFDSRAAAQGLPPEKTPHLELQIPQPSSGSATVGYRSAKYTPAEWHSNCFSILRQADTHRDTAWDIQQDSKTLCQDTEAATAQTQAVGTRLLGQRLQDIHFWKSELQRHIDQLRADTESLLALKARLEKTLDTTETPYAIATDNVNCRRRRPAPDLVRDIVEEELLKEVDLIRSIQALLKTTTAQVVSQIRNNRDAKQMLELDWSDKYQAYNLDDICGRYNNMSPDTRRHPSSATQQEQVCNPISWTNFTRDNLSKALQEEKASETLRELVERVLNETTDDLRVQCSVVNQAFSHRCEELIEAKTQLEMKQAEVLEQIGIQEKNIVALQLAIQNKEAPLRVAQSRLYVRTFRPNMELCRDEPQLRYTYFWKGRWARLMPR